MPEKSTFIKIDRNIMEWGWYQNGNTFRVFLHILLKANIKDKKFEKITIHRGELAVSIDSLSNALGLSFQQIRTALAHLKSTGEITVTRYSKFQVISIKNYDFYQSGYENQQSVHNQSTGSQQANHNQITTTKEYKESKEKKECKETISSDFSESSKRKSARQAREEAKPDWFEEVWKLYPRKEGKQAITAESFESLAHAGKETIIKAVENYRKKTAENHTEKKYIKMGSTFFNGAWEDFVNQEEPEVSQSVQEKYSGSEWDNLFNLE